MTDPYIGEIRVFPIDYAPTGWATCDGQIMLIQQNTALFSLIGVTYGGNGTTNFALPNLQGRVPVHQGQGRGLSPYYIGENGGSEAVTLLTSQVPQHTHSLQGNQRQAELNTPGPANSLARSTPVTIYKTPAGIVPAQPLASGALGNPVGGNQPHNNLMPYITLNICIALTGVYPTRG